MKLFIPLIMLASLTGSAVGHPFDALRQQMQTRIDHASERGRLEEARALRLDLAHHAVQAGYYLEATRQYELLLAARPRRKERVRLFTELGKLREAISDWNGAISAYADARHDDPESWVATLSQARVFVKVGMYRQAEDNYQLCLKMRPNAVEAMDELAGVYRERGFLKRAIDTYEKAILMQPIPSSFIGLAECYRRRNDVPQALAVLRRAQEQSPSPQYNVMAGSLYRRQGQLVSAVHAWESAVALDDTRDDLRLALVFLKEQTGQKAAADALLLRLLKAYPQSPVVRWTQAWILKSRGDRKGALKVASIVDELAPTDLVKHYNARLRQETNP